MPDWMPVPYYYTGPLNKIKVPTVLPHKLGYLPPYIKKAVIINGLRQPDRSNK